MDGNAFFVDELQGVALARLTTAGRVNQGRNIQLAQLVVQRVPKLVTQAGWGHGVALGGIGVEQAANETLLFDAKLQLIKAIDRAGIAVLRQARDRSKTGGEHGDRAKHQIVHVLRPQRGDPGRLDRVHLHVGARRQKLDVGPHPVHQINDGLTGHAHRFVGQLWRKGRVGAAGHQLGHEFVALGWHHDVGM